MLQRIGYQDFFLLAWGFRNKEKDTSWPFDHTASPNDYQQKGLNFPTRLNFHNRMLQNKHSQLAICIVIIYTTCFLVDNLVFPTNSKRNLLFHLTRINHNQSIQAALSGCRDPSAAMMMMLALREVFPRLSSCFGFGAVVGWMLGDGRGGLDAGCIF